MKYGKAAQEVAPLNTTEELDESGKKRIQMVVGSFLFYGRAVDLTILAALSAITGQQSKNQQIKQSKELSNSLTTWRRILK